MTRNYLIKGFVNNFHTEEYFKKSKFDVLVTKDNLGITLSIGSKDKGLMYTIPLDQIYKDLRKFKRL